MADQFVTYRSFIDKAIATELCRLLAENEIQFKWEGTEGFFDATFANNEVLNHYYVKLRPGDFKRADELLMKLVEKNNERPPDDYYLLSFSNDELKDLLQAPDEWNEYDLYWAKKILEERGIELPAREIQKAKEERLTQLKKPWILSKVWVFGAIVMWIVAYWFVHILWAVGVVFIGGYILLSKKTMPDGQRVTAFSEGDRFFGKIIFGAGIILVVLIILVYYQVIDFLPFSFWPDM